MARFSVGARAIDLLGRQQVAGTPTAISELFKNAHDAYADRVQVDYYRARDLLVLRDDGVGMTRAEFETRWLTAATDSKRDDAFTDPPPVDPDKTRRPVMGEKGIGRLAIAVLGAQVLVLTRSKGAGLEGGITACFIHWGVFSLPTVTLDDIDLAMEEFPAGIVPGAENVGNLISRSIASVETLRGRTDAKAIDDIVADMKGFLLNPNDLSGASAGELGLVNGFGTHFYVAPVRPEIASDIDGYDRSKRATSIQKVLIGFYNTMLPQSPEPVMTTSFRDHKPNVRPVDLIGEQEFFTPDDFEVADHHIEGAFDARGQFSGRIDIYGQEARNFQTHWPNGNGKDTRCGPFKLSLAYVQGVRADSSLSDVDFDKVTEKLTKYGGLYIYRDGIRILPYGDSDYDFLDFEQRRSRSASYYFFSYRRMFGVIDVTRAFNSGLVEKAGREGFQENTAYKQFKSILEYFFVQTAAVFFRKDGTEAEQFFRKEEELNKRHALLEKRRKQIGPQRGKLKADLTTFLDAVASGTFRREADAIVTAALQSLGSATVEGMTVVALRTIDRDARQALDDIDDRGKIVRPRAVGLTRDLTNLWARYEVERRRLVDEILLPARRVLGEAVRDTTERLDLAFDRHEEALGRLGERVTRENQAIRAKARRAKTGADTAIRQVTEVVAQSVRRFEAESTAKLVEFEALDFEGMSEPEFTAAHERLDADLLAVAAEQAEHLDQLLDQVSRLGKDHDASEATLAALETELEDRRERETESLRLAQMGLAIGIVHHEFHAVTRSVSASIGRLARWAERNPKLGDVYRQIAESYAHLDSYLGLFAPLNRRLGQSKRLIEGREIGAYLSQLLGDRMRRHGVEMSCTTTFEEVVIAEYAATIFPCFVNMADNAVFWMDVGAEVTVETDDETPSDRPKVLTLDFVDGAFVMSDTGPGILPADEGAIFESGFSRKPGGSGLGLHITKSLLERSGYTLTLDPYVRGRGATFRIKPPASSIPQETS